MTQLNEKIERWATDGSTAKMRGMAGSADELTTFARNVCRAAMEQGWKVFVNVSRPHGTDLVLIRGGRIVIGELHPEAAELKTDDDWCSALRANGHSACRWKPSDWPAVLSVLNRGY